MRVGPVVGVFALLALVGCSGGTFNEIQTQASNVAGARLAGVVHGGQQAIVGAHVYLFAAGTTGYGGAGIAASTGNASVSLLTSAGNTALDSSGGPTSGDYYVTTDANGNFSISGDYTCSTGQQVYLYALGGNPGSGTNSAAGLMAVLGNCPAAGNFAAATPFVMVNEVSTVAAAYAMAGFATDAMHVGSSGTALALTGIANAFANAGNLADLASGAALATTPAGNGTVPQRMTNMLANMLAACVNSAGSSSSACTTLFNYARSAGSSGIAASDTATAAINVVHNPGTGVPILYSLASATPPFAPAMTVQPNDFTIGIQFTGGGMNSPDRVAFDGSGNAWIANYAGNSITKLSSSGAVLSGTTGYTGGGLSGPFGVAIDGSGNAWVPNSLGNSVTELSNLGVVLSGSTGYTAGGLNEPSGIAIDQFGNAWIANEQGGHVVQISGAGAVLSGASGYASGGFSGPFGIAVDGSGSVWVTNFNPSNVTVLSKSGAVLSGTQGYTGGGIDSPEGIAIDGFGNAWAANYLSNSVTEISNSGSLISGANGYLGGGINGPIFVAIDGAGNLWVSNAAVSRIAEFSSSGVPISGIVGFASGYLNGPGGISIDGSGNAWVSNSYANTVIELVGVAAPVITPISAGLPATPTADGSSKLGTRP